jgi:acetyltransferase-like isoleucine patch superfamily enzyme
MRNKLYLLLSLCISLLPLNILRVFFYRILFRYKIHNSKIGWLTIINIEQLELTNASIAAFNFCSGPLTLKMFSGSTLGSFNYIKCGKWAKEFHSKRLFIVEKNVTITTQHVFDVFGEIQIGEGSFIAGVRSQFWTHGSMSDNIDIKIGKECYIGSGTKFAPGSALADQTLCAMGSVVTKVFTEPNTFIAGVPAKKIKEKIKWKEKWK